MERTQAPTPRRIRQARQRGEVPRSSHLSSGAILVVGVVALLLWTPVIAAECIELSHSSFALVAAPSPSLASANVLIAHLASVGWSLLPPLLIVWSAAALVGLLQVGPLFTVQPITPSSKRLTGGSIFTTQPLNVVLQAVRLGVIGGLVLHYSIATVPQLFSSTPRSLSDALLVAGDVAFGLAWRLALAMFLLGVLDYLWERGRWLKGLKMTRQEIAHEQRLHAANPEMRREARRRVER